MVQDTTLIFAQKENTPNIYRVSKENAFSERELDLQIIEK
jgi:hypothetical protein